MLDLGLKPFEKFSLPETITGQRVVLCRRTHAHDAELFNLIDHSRAFLRRFLFWIDDTKTITDVITVTDIFSKNWDKKDAFEYVFLDKQAHKIVGAGGIHTISYMNKTAEFGYYLDEKAVGNGYASEAVSLLEEALFQKGIHRLVIQCDSDNAASKRVAERNDFVLEGCLKQAKYAYGGYRDQLIYAKLNPNG